MPTSQHHLDQIEKELAMARAAIKAGNDGMVRVCARRAAGQALTWYVTKFPRPRWRPDAINQLTHVKDDLAFPHDVREAADRLTRKISDTFTYPSATDPVEDACIIIRYITEVMQADV